MSILRRQLLTVDTLVHDRLVHHQPDNVQQGLRGLPVLPLLYEQLIVVDAVPILSHDGLVRVPKLGRIRIVHKELLLDLRGENVDCPLPQDDLLKRRIHVLEGVDDFLGCLLDNEWGEEESDVAL